MLFKYPLPLTLDGAVLVHFNGYTIGWAKFSKYSGAEASSKFLPTPACTSPLASAVLMVASKPS